VDVRVADRLAARRAHVDAEVPAVGRLPALEPLAREAHEPPHRGLFWDGESEVVRLVAPGDDQRVAGGQREAVGEGGGELVRDHDVARRDAVTEDAGGQRAPQRASW
jgi:hypothetical protein